MTPTRLAFPAMPTLQDLLQRLIDQEGSQEKARTKLAISSSIYGRAKKSGALDVRHCLMLAAALRECPSVVLRAARKGDIADLIEAMYGGPTKIDRRTDLLLPGERELLRTWRELPPNLQAHGEGFLRELKTHLAPDARRRKRPTRGSDAA